MSQLFVKLQQIKRILNNVHQFPYPIYINYAKIDLKKAFNPEKLDYRMLCLPEMPSDSELESYFNTFVTMRRILSTSAFDDYNAKYDEFYSECYRITRTIFMVNSTSKVLEPSEHLKNSKIYKVPQIIAQQVSTNKNVNIRYRVTSSDPNQIVSLEAFDKLRLGRKRHRTIENFESFECPICLEDIENPKETFYTCPQKFDLTKHIGTINEYETEKECGHRICKGCHLKLQKKHKKNGKVKCPQCNIEKIMERTTVQINN